MHELRSTLTLLTAGANPLDLEDIKAHLREDSDDTDDLIQAYADAALAYMDGRDGILGRALLSQQWRMTRESFSHHPAWSHLGYGGEYRYNRYPFSFVERNEIKIPLPPLKTIDAITYLDPAGQTQTLDPTLYRVLKGGGFRSSIIPTTGNCWPATQCVPDAVTIDFTCGYDDADALKKERKGILQAMLMIIDNWYENREAALVGSRAAAIDLPFGVEALLAPHRIPSL